MRSATLLVCFSAALACLSPLAAAVTSKYIAPNWSPEEEERRMSLIGLESYERLECPWRVWDKGTWKICLYDGHEACDDAHAAFHCRENDYDCDDRAIRASKYIVWLWDCHWEYEPLDSVQDLWANNGLDNPTARDEAHDRSQYGRSIRFDGSFFI